ncbi:MAG: trypsin-like peptidase domain-containing protein [Actinomycetales bacterium]|nr:trypsin-like peptidase domain-containing protein [Actinomycetales bacterium]
MRRPAPASAVVGVLVLALCGACSALPEIPPMPDGPLPTAPTPTASFDPAAAVRNDLSPDGFDVAERISVRVRNLGCFSLSTGSGFAVGETTLVTNRHVVEDSAELALSTYDGRDVGVRAASIAELADLAVVRTDGELPAVPELATEDPERGDTITVVGYPQGGRLTVTSGRVIARTTDPLNLHLGEVLVTDALVEPGSSGSPALDRRGRVVGVVYAMNEAEQSFIVPVSTLHELLEDDDAFKPVKEESFVCD